MKHIKKAEFYKSTASSEDFPGGNTPEIVFAGRSNVGKSSLINSLVNVKNLAKTSSTPGKTRLINYFKIDDLFYFVDLPGYGYAKVSDIEKEKWKKLIEDYFTLSGNIRLVILIIDIRRGILEKDKELIIYLDFLKLPYLIVLTKYDKVSKNEALKIKTKLEDMIDSREIVFFSSKTKFNKEKIVNIIYSYINT